MICLSKSIRNSWVRHLLPDLACEFFIAKG